MGFELPTPAKQNERAEENTSRGKTSSRLLFTLDKLKKTMINKTEVIGRENLAEIPKDKKVVIATTHITDADVWLSALELGNDFDINITNQSVHHKAFGKNSELPTNIGMRMAGKENFLPIDYNKTEDGRKNPGIFNPENFVAMEKALENGKAVLIAAHKPSHSQELEKGGYGVVYLAELSNAIILPVAVDVESEGVDDMYKHPTRTILKRSNAKITIGKPFSPEKIEGIELFSKILEKRKNGEKISKEELIAFSKIKKELEKKSDELMKCLASMVPEKKRGQYS